MEYGLNGFMFSNVGTKIKKLAKILAWIDIIISIIGGVIMFFAGLFDPEYLWFLIFLAPVTVLLGFLLAWLSTVLLYGFGELIEKSQANEKNTKEIACILKKQFPESTKEASTKKEPQNFGINQAVSLNHSATATAATENNTVICLLCGCEQPAERNVCWHCGAKFEKKDTPSSTHRWLCGSCGKMRTQSPCEHCGDK